MLSRIRDTIAARSRFRVPPEGAASEIFDSLAKQFGDGGWTETDSGTVSIAGTTTKPASFENTDRQVMLIINETEGEITVTYSVSPAAS